LYVNGSIEGVDGGGGEVGDELVSHSGTKSSSTVARLANVRKTRASVARSRRNFAAIVTELRGGQRVG
jgi:hypothetical protein